MRIVQIIDSLHVGGAERMAVNYANALAGEIEFSGIVATRKEGALKSQINANVDYLFLEKKRSVDISAVLRLKAYCKKNKIGWIHAHGTSFFIAFLLKMAYPKINIIWHEHKGARSGETLSENRFLSLSSKFFSGIIVVDHTLEQWCTSVLKFKKVLYLPNFTIFAANENKATVLKGETGKRILCLANLRQPKNHMLLVKSAIEVAKKFPDWTCHLIGNDFDDAYSKNLKSAIKENALEETVYIYGLREDTGNCIEQSEICVLTSISEGLPVALLEYGMHRKAVAATAVGEIPLIIENGENGFTVASEDPVAFAKALVSLIENSQLRHDFGEALYQTINKNHSQEAVIGQYLSWLNNL